MNTTKTDFSKTVDAYLKTLGAAVDRGAIGRGNLVTFAWTNSTIDKNCMLIAFSIRGDAILVEDAKKTACANDSGLYDIFAKKLARFASNRGMTIKRRSLRR
jgi:hypothetical protein